MDEKKNHGSKKYTAICFTINNHDEDWESDMERLFNEGYFTYLVVGEETGESGTDHLQGYGELKKRTRLGAIKRFSNDFKRAHVESRRGTGEQAAVYCKKDDAWREWGEMKLSAQGKRSDLDKLREMVGEGEYNMLNIMNDCDAAFKYPQAVRTYVALFKKAKRTRMELTLKPWQDSLNGTLTTTVPDQRKVLWFWEATGGTGKTTMARYLVRNHGAFYCNGGKTTDIAYAYEEEKIVVFDFTRSQEEHINYGVIESLKNGMITSNKYQSCTKVFDIPHVVVFANFEPDYEKLSQDRWEVKEII
ncbi:hypothetical protein [uncultured marine virus]|uniref:CRESS-DNA virus Rep endonuclease domain-containing protein n=1 Tax=uncultured marine virus TaxID=186617 RepID=S4TDM2_9VIRU|nr:hypothetical protein [uncultured marine virus]